MFVECRCRFTQPTTTDLRTAVEIDAVAYKSHVRFTIHTSNNPGAKEGGKMNPGTLYRRSAFTDNPKGGNPAGVWIGEA